MDYDNRSDPECVACSFSPICLGGRPAQRMLRAEKELVCSPQRFNFHERIGHADGAAVDQETTTATGEAATS
jgi:sulfatase maturation enzyme AslB (radical SAM superfamily)